MVEKPDQPGDLAGATDQPTVQADGHHRRPALGTFGAQDIPRVDQIVAELPRPAP
jgi:hypothetical protein